ncbi:MAG: glycosyltransferase family 9 protein [Betaproteobacteria bacterium]
MSTLGAPRQSRFAGRAQVVARAMANRAGSIGRRRAPRDPRRILVAHHLLLGDTLMLTPLLAKIRERHPRADIVMALPESYAPMYAARPYGVRAIGWHPSTPAASALWREDAFDLALVPGDNRFAWLALALDSRWIVAFDGDRPARKSWPVDELRPYPASAAAWGDIAATLIDGPPPAPYRVADWPAPPMSGIELPPKPYAVLHVGASTPLKRWDAERWRALAATLAASGLEPVWSAGRGEEALVAACDGARRHRSFAGALSTEQLWHLVAGASLLVAPDSGVAHLGRVAGTPTVALFGPGSATISGAGEFWRDAPYRAVTVTPFDCRDQRILFKRELDWVRRCGRSVAQCPHPRCMDAIEPDLVHAAIAALRGRAT